MVGGSKKGHTKDKGKLLIRHNDQLNAIDVKPIPKRTFQSKSNPNIILFKRESVPTMTVKTSDDSNNLANNNDSSSSITNNAKKSKADLLSLPSSSQPHIQISYSKEPKGGRTFSLKGQSKVTLGIAPQLHPNTSGTSSSRLNLKLNIPMNATLLGDNTSSDSTDTSVYPRSIQFAVQWNSLSCEAREEAFHIAEALRIASIEGNKRRWFSIYKHAMSGEDIVNWLLATDRCKTVEEATQCGHLLVIGNFLQGVPKEMDFRNRKRTLFRLVNENLEQKRPSARTLLSSGRVEIYGWLKVLRRQGVLTKTPKKKYFCVLMASSSKSATLYQYSSDMATTPLGFLRLPKRPYRFKVRYDSQSSPNNFKQPNRHSFILDVRGADEEEVCMTLQAPSAREQENWIHKLIEAGGEYVEPSRKAIVNARNIYQFSIFDMENKPVSLDVCKGKVTLIVNISCSHAETMKKMTQYEALFNKFRERGFTIFAFPCNQFAGKPCNAADAKTLVSDMDISFHMMQPIKVNGEECSPLFSYLRAQLKDQSPYGIFIKSNFEGFLCNREGIPVMRMLSDTKMLAYEHAINNLLQGKRAQENTNFRHRAHNLNIKDLSYFSTPKFRSRESQEPSLLQASTLDFTHASLPRNTRSHQGYFSSFQNGSYQPYLLNHQSIHHVHSDTCPDYAHANNIIHSTRSVSLPRLSLWQQQQQMQLLQQQQHQQQQQKQVQLLQQQQHQQQQPISNLSPTQQHPYFKYYHQYNPQLHHISQQYQEEQTSHSPIGSLRASRTAPSMIEFMHSSLSHQSATERMRSVPMSLSASYSKDTSNFMQTALWEQKRRHSALPVYIEKPTLTELDIQLMEQFESAEFGPSSSSEDDEDINEKENEADNDDLHFFAEQDNNRVSPSFVVNNLEEDSSSSPEAHFDNALSTSEQQPQYLHMPMHHRNLLVEHEEASRKDSAVLSTSSRDSSPSLSSHTQVVLSNGGENIASTSSLTPITNHRSIMDEYVFGSHCTNVEQEGITKKKKTRGRATSLIPKPLSDEAVRHSPKKRQYSLPLILSDGELHQSAV